MKTALQWVGGFASVLAIGYLALMLARWALLASSEGPRVRSPDGSTDAVHLTVSAGAASGAMHEVYLVPAGARPTPGGLILRGGEIDRLELRWTTPRELRIDVKGDVFLARFRSRHKDVKITLATH